MLTKTSVGRDMFRIGSRTQIQTHTFDLKPTDTHTHDILHYTSQHSVHIPTWQSYIVGNDVCFSSYKVDHTQQHTFKLKSIKP